MKVNATDTNRDVFARLYTEALTLAVTNHPDDYAYPVSAVPETVNRMMAAIERGGFNNSPTLKRVARKLGIKDTLSGIRAYVTFS